MFICIYVWLINAPMPMGQYIFILFKVHEQYSAKLLDCRRNCRPHKAFVKSVWSCPYVYINNAFM